MPMTPDDAKKMFSPLYPIFWASVRQAFTRYFEINRDELGAIHERTKSSYINDLVVKNLKQMIPSDFQPEWESKKGQRRFWILSGIACVRAKKVDLNLHPHNLATQAQWDFYDNLIKPHFPNMQSATPLVLGYTMNLTKTAPRGLYIICADGVLNHKHTKVLENIKPVVKWVLQIPDETSEMPQTLPSFVTPEPPMPKRVKTKYTGAQRKTKKEE